MTLRKTLPVTLLNTRGYLSPRLCKYFNKLFLRICEFTFWVTLAGPGASTRELPDEGDAILKIELHSEDEGAAQ